MRAATGVRKSGAALVLGMLAVSGAVSHAQTATASWMDQPAIASWNAPGQAIPAAPAVPDPVNPRCREMARPPERDEDKQLRSRGWDLVGAFEIAGDPPVVRATSASTSPTAAGK